MKTTVSGIGSTFAGEGVNLFSSSQCHVEAKKKCEKHAKGHKKKPEAHHFRLKRVYSIAYIYYTDKSLVSIRRYSTGVRPVTSWMRRCRVRMFEKPVSSAMATNV